MSQIFISYAHEDIDFAQMIVDALAECNLDTWIDRKNIPKGEYWEQEIYRGIEGADAFLFLISSDSVTSEVCNKEIVHAIKNGKRILPIFISNAENKDVYAVTGKFLNKESQEEINRRNFIFCRKGQDDFKAAIEEIRETFHTDYAWLKFHTRLQVKALEWERRKEKKDTSLLLRGKELQDADERLEGIQIDPQPTKLQRSYLLESRKNEARIRRQLTIGLGIGLVVVASLAIIAWGQRNSAIESEKLAVAESHSRATAQVMAEQQYRIALARQLAVQAQSVSESSPVLSLLLSVEAVQATTDFEEPVVPEALQAILDQLNAVGGTPLPGHTGGVTTVAFSPLCETSPDRCWLATGAGDGSIRLWKYDLRKPIMSLVFSNAHEGEVTKIDISPDGNWLASGGIDGFVRLWNLKELDSDALPIEFEGQGTGVSQVAFTPDGDHLITGDYTVLRMWDLKPRISKEPKILMRDSINALTFSDDGRWLAAGGIGFTVYLWDLWAEDPLDTQQESFAGENIFALDFSVDGRWLAAGSEENLAKVWDLSTGELDSNPRELESHIWPVITLGFTSEALLTGSSDGDIRVWEPGSGYLTNESVISGNPGLSQIKIGPGGGPIAVSWDNKIDFWDEIWRSFSQTSSSHDGRINDFAFSPDSAWLATGGEDSIARIYSIRDGLVSNPRKMSQDDLTDLSISTSYESGWIGRREYSDLLNEYPTLDFTPLLTSYDFFDLALSPSGRWLLICDWDGNCWLWDLQADSLETPIKTFKGHSNEIASLVFSADEQWLATSGLSDGVIWIWDLDFSDSVDQSLTLYPGQPMQIQYFDPEEGWLVAQEIDSYEFESWVWQLKWENLIDIACEVVGRNLTGAEWQQYSPSVEYNPTCPQWPSGE